MTQFILFFFLPVWLCGIGLTVAVWRRTRTSSPRTRLFWSSLILALTFTPSIVGGGHGFAPVPIVIVLFYLPFSTADSPVFWFFFTGILPLLVSWPLVAIILAILRFVSRK